MKNTEFLNAFNKSHIGNLITFLIYLPKKVKTLLEKENNKIISTEGQNLIQTLSLFFPEVCRILQCSQIHLALASCERRSLAAATMLRRAGLTSVYLRVLRPQSGFTQRMLLSKTASILLILSAISSVEGIRGEWMS